MSGPKVVAIGGGHGLATTVRALTTYAGHLTAVVATLDDGGSSGRLRADLHVPAPGDLRRCLTTLAPDRKAADAFEHRFSAGELEGHAVGNLVLAGLVDAGHDLASAADLVSGWLRLDPASVRVLPATQEPVAIVATTDGGEVRGQVAVEAAAGVRHLVLDPPDPDVCDEVVAAIDDADQIVLGPGSFHTSVLGAVLPPAISKGVASSSARVVLVANLDADVGAHLTMLREHGVTPTDVVVHTATSLGVADEHVAVTSAALARPHGLAHDAALLAPVLATLVG